MKRYGAVIGLDEARAEEYKALHVAVWPEVLAMIRDCHIRDYTIYLRRMDDGRLYLFSTFEYHGVDYEADMARMAADPATQRWWAVCMPMQRPIKSRAEGEWWAPMEEVFHAD